MYVCLIQQYVGGFDRQVAALRHGFTGVHSEIHEDLLDLAGINFHEAERGLEGGLELYVLADEPLQHLRSIGDDRIQVQHDRLKHLLAAEGEELAGQ